ncbi:hypothetical protein FKP32DRAFT_1602692 [Trametes sanguinea]|nr:hypothetical protein FKP32DRAFT_1602692 [Trametes sanguinea]
MSMGAQPPQVPPLAASNGDVPPTSEVLILPTLSSKSTCAYTGCKMTNVAAPAVPLDPQRAQGLTAGGAASGATISPGVLDSGHSYIHSNSELGGSGPFLAECQQTVIMDSEVL